MSTLDTEEIKKEDNIAEKNKLVEIQKEQKKNIKSKKKILKNIYDKFKGINGFFVILIMIIASIIIASNSCAVNNGFYEGELYEQLLTNIKIKFKEVITDNPNMDDLKDLFYSYCDIKKYNNIFKNGVIIFSTMLLIYAISGKPKFSTIFALIFWTFIDIVNYIVFDLRGTPFALADIFSITTAVAVVDGMKVEFEKRFFKFVGISFITLFIVAIIKFRKDKNNKVHIAKRVVSLLICIIMITCVLNINGFKTDSYWNLEESYRVKGIAAGLLRQTLDINIKKPEGYSVQKAQEILNRYKPEINQDEKINVFVIANESFADINNIYKLGLQDNMPYYNSLTENVIKGTVYTSVFGGSTATVEWEFLTGNSAAFIPPNSIPFLVYVRGDKDTLVRDATNQNYATYSLHSFYERCYNRANIYKNMGFQNRTFKEQMRDYVCIRPDYPSDSTTYKNMIKQYENRDKSKKFFGYILTMQNHIAYNTPEAFYKNKGYVQDNYQFDQYLSLINDSDIALKEFIEYFSKEEEKTILLLFGDHQPKVEFLHEESEEWLIEQKVPYLLWANFDIEEKQGEDISFNYLSTLIYDYANLNTNQYIEFLKELKQEIPVYTAKGYKDKNGKTYEIDDETSPYYEKLKEYKILQYYFMFDK